MLLKEYLHFLTVEKWFLMVLKLELSLQDMQVCVTRAAKVSDRKIFNRDS